MKPERTDIGSAPSTLFCFARAGVFVRSLCMFITPGAVGTVTEPPCGLRLTQETQETQEICCAVVDIYFSPVGFAG